MGVRGDLVTIRHFQADGEIAGRGHGIAFENGELRSRRQEWRRWTELYLIRREGVLRYRWLRCEHRKCSDEQSDNKKRQFHWNLLMDRNDSQCRPQPQ